MSSSAGAADRSNDSLHTRLRDELLMRLRFWRRSDHLLYMALMALSYRFSNTGRELELANVREPFSHIYIYSTSCALDRSAQVNSAKAEKPLTANPGATPAQSYMLPN